MSNYIPPADKADGDILYGVDWNGFKNGLASYLNNGGIGNAQVSSDPAQRIAGSKIDLGGGVTASAHASRHAPGGADELNDLDIANSGTPVSAHHARHEFGGADAIAVGSLDANVLKEGTLPQPSLAWRKRQESFIQNALGVTADPKNPRLYTLTNTSANLQGRGVVRGGKLYMAAVGFSPDAVLKIDIDAGTETLITMAVGDVVKGLVLIGTNIYVLISGGAANCLIKKIDSNDVVTTVVDLNTGGGTLTSTGFLRCNHDGTRLFCLGSGATNFVVGVNTDGSNLTRTNTGAVVAFHGLVYAKRGSDEKLWYLDNTAVNNVLNRRNIDGTADATLTLTGALHRRLIFDGEHLVVGFSGGAITHQVVDPWGTMRVLMSLANPTTVSGGGSVDDLATDAPTDIDIFDGRAVHFAGRSGGGPLAAVLSFYPSEGYRALAREVGNASAVSPSAVAADSTYFYVFFSSAGANGVIRRMLRD